MKVHLNTFVTYTQRDGNNQIQVSFTVFFFQFPPSVCKVSLI